MNSRNGDSDLWKDQKSIHIVNMIHFLADGFQKRFVPGDLASIDICLATR